MFSWDKVQRPILALAPMSGFTDYPFRQIVKKICSETICFTEFTSIEGLLRGNPTSKKQLCFDAKQKPLIAQIFGGKPENFFKTAKLLAELKVDAIDINMGCPARKVVHSDNGSALLKNPSLAFEIVKAAVEGGHLPVSVKMRIGIAQYDEKHFLNFGKGIEQAGAQLITVHGRTAKQMYDGNADWRPIYSLKKILKISVIGNGDIKCAADASSRLGNLDGIMIGRTAIGNPWIFREIALAFKKKNSPPVPAWEKFNLIKQHLDLACLFNDEKWGVIEMRKHLCAYVRGLPNAARLRQKLVSAETQKQIVEILAQAFM